MTASYTEDNYADNHTLIRVWLLFDVHLHLGVDIFDVHNRIRFCIYAKYKIYTLFTILLFGRSATDCKLGTDCTRKWICSLSAPIFMKQKS